MMAERKVPDPQDPGGALVAADDVTLMREAATILLAFKRFSPQQIATMLNIAPEKLAEIGSDHDVQEAIEGLTSLLPRPGQIHELLMSDAERNVRWMRSLREGRVDGVRLGVDDKTLRVRADMAKALLDRQVAKKTEIAVKPLREIDVTDIQRKRMEELIEVPVAIDASATPVPAPRALTDADFDP